MSGQWTDMIAGARMQVDQQFQQQVIDSQFSNQQWGLIMTAVQFEIVAPETPEEAEIVANTEQVQHIIPELDNIPDGMGGAPQRSNKGDKGGLLGRVASLFEGSDSGSGSNDEREAAAVSLVQAYAVELQNFLEQQGRWEDICAAYAEQQSDAQSSSESR